MRKKGSFFFFGFPKTEGGGAKNRTRSVYDSTWCVWLQLSPVERTHRAAREMISCRSEAAEALQRRRSALFCRCRGQDEGQLVEADT